MADWATEFVDKANGFTGTPQANTEALFNKLSSDSDLKLTPEQADGIAMQGYKESNTQSVNEAQPVVPGSRGGYGIFQWTGPRRVEFENWAKDNGRDPASVQAQYDYVKQDLLARPDFLKQLRGAKTPDDAYAVWGREYEQGQGLPDKATQLPTVTVTAKAPAQTGDWAQEFLKSLPEPEAQPDVPQANGAAAQAAPTPNPPVPGGGAVAAPATPEQYGPGTNFANAAMGGTLPQYGASAKATPAGVATPVNPMTGLPMPGINPAGEAQAQAEVEAAKSAYEQAHPAQAVATNVAGSLAGGIPFMAAGEVAGPAGRVAAGAGIGALAGALNTDSSAPAWERAAVGGAAGAGLGLAGEGLGRLAGHVTDEVAHQLSQTLSSGESVAKALKLTPAQVTTQGGKIGALGAVTGAKSSTVGPDQMAELDKRVAAAANIVTTSGKPAEHISPETIDSTMEYAGRRLDNVANVSGVDLKYVAQPLQNTARWVAQEPSLKVPDRQIYASALINGVTRAFGKAGRLTGQDYQNLTQKGGAIWTAIHNPDPGIQQLGQRLRTVLDNGLEATAGPDAAAEISAARAQYRNAVQLSSVANQGPAVGINPTRFSQLVFNNRLVDPTGDLEKLAYGARYMRTTGGGHVGIGDLATAIGADEVLNRLPLAGPAAVGLRHMIGHMVNTPARGSRLVENAASNPALRNMLMRLGGAVGAGTGASYLNPLGAQGGP